jgi:hypothetical protein
LQNRLAYLPGFLQGLHPLFSLSNREQLAPFDSLLYDLAGDLGDVAAFLPGELCYDCS